MKTVSLYNLGCSKNFVDGENITGYMAANGFKIIASCEEADIIIVNTCSFIEDATKEAISLSSILVPLSKMPLKKRSIPFWEWGRLRRIAMI